MRLALIGSHGVGKTTVFDRLKARRPDAAFFSEAVRHQMPAFGIGHPIDDVCRTYGIGAFELFNMNAWSVIDPAVNTQLASEKLVITDRCTLDSTAYFLAMRATEIDRRLESLVLAIGKYYAGLYDLFVYFPTGKFQLRGDAMRPADEAFQQRVDLGLFQAMRMFQVPGRKLHRLEAASVDARVEEILALLPAP